MFCFIVVRLKFEFVCLRCYCSKVEEGSSKRANEGYLSTAQLSSYGSSCHRLRVNPIEWELDSFDPRTYSIQPFTAMQTRSFYKQATIHRSSMPPHSGQQGLNPTKHDARLILPLVCPNSLRGLEGRRNICAEILFVVPDVN